MALERAWQTMWKTTTNLNGAITLTRIVPQSGLQAFSNASPMRSAPQSGSKGSGGVSSYLRLPAQSGLRYRAPISIAYALTVGLS